MVTKNRLFYLTRGERRKYNVNRRGETEAWGLQNMEGPSSAEGVKLSGIPHWPDHHTKLHNRNDTDDPVAFINSSDYVDILLEPSYPWVVPAGSLIIQGEAVYLDY